MNVNGKGISIVKLERTDVAVIGIYRSQEGNISDLIDMISELVPEDKLCVIGGDLNINILKNPNNSLTTNLMKNGFEQIVKIGTHIEGGLIDHIYIKHGREKAFSWALEHFPKYYSDHDGLGLTIWQINKENSTY